MSDISSLLIWLGLSILITTFICTLVRLVPHNGWVELSWDFMAYALLISGNLLEPSYAFAALWIIMAIGWCFRVQRSWRQWRERNVADA